MVLQDGCVRHIYPGFFSWFRVGGWVGWRGMMPSKYEIRIMMTMMELKVLGNRWQSR